MSSKETTPPDFDFASEYFDNADEDPFSTEFSKDDLVVSLSDDELNKKEERYVNFYDEPDEKKPTLMIDFDSIEMNDPKKEFNPLQAESEDEDADESEEDKEPKEAKSKKRLELDDILNYSEDLHKKQAFRYEYGSIDEVTPEDKKMQDDFNDFLEFRKITGRTKGLDTINLIKAGSITNQSQEIEIKDLHGFSSNEALPNTKVITHKNEHGEVTGIEVVCSCGVRTVIKLDYEQEEQEDNSDTYDSLFNTDGDLNLNDDNSELDGLDIDSESFDDTEL